MFQSAQFGSVQFSSDQFRSVQFVVVMFISVTFISFHFRFRLSSFFDFCFFSFFFSRCGTSLPEQWQKADVFEDWQLDDPDGQPLETFRRVRSEIKTHVEA